MDDVLLPPNEACRGQGRMEGGMHHILGFSVFDQIMFPNGSHRHSSLFENSNLSGHAVSAATACLKGDDDDDDDVELPEDDEPPKSKRRILRRTSSTSIYPYTDKILNTPHVPKFSAEELRTHRCVAMVCRAEHPFKSS